MAKAPFQALRRVAAAVLSVLLLGVGLTACAPASGKLTTPNIDYATYSLLSLVVKDQGWLETELLEQGVDVNWVFANGSNKANEYLRSQTVARQLRPARWMHGPASIRSSRAASSPALGLCMRILS